MQLGHEVSNARSMGLSCLVYSMRLLKNVYRNTTMPSTAVTEKVFVLESGNLIPQILLFALMGLCVFMCMLLCMSMHRCTHMCACALGGDSTTIPGVIAPSPILFPFKALIFLFSLTYLCE